MKSDIKSERIQEALDRVLMMFETGEFPEAITQTMITPPPGFERPSDKWSLGNKILRFLAGTSDARGYKQWKKVGRYVKKGARAFYIFGPTTRKIKEKVIDKETGEEKEEERTILTGFRLIPVFRYEDTEGEPLIACDFDPPELPPLHDVAKKFGVKEVVYSPQGGNSLGFFSWAGGEKRIVLHSHDIEVWFHELGHAVHATFRKQKGGQVPEQEIVAEVFAAVMCELHGVQGYHSQAWQYIKYYADDEPKKALKSVFRILSDVEECLKRVFAVAEEENSKKEKIASA